MNEAHPSKAIELLQWFAAQPNERAYERNIPEELRIYLAYLKQRAWVIDGAPFEYRLYDFGRIALEGEDTPKAKSKAATKATAVLETLLGNEAQQILEIAQSHKSVDDRMRAICLIDLRHLAWDSPKWANLLNVSEAAIRKTKFWKEDRPRAIEANRL